MKKVTILVALALVFVLAGCTKGENGKKKQCKCTSTQSWDIEEMEPMVSTSTLTINEGECSDLNAIQTMNAGGQTYTMVMECVEI